MNSIGKIILAVVACVLAAVAGPEPVHATGVPIDGFLPMAGISLTREFVDDILPLAPVPSTFMTEPQLGAGGVPYYDVALLDTGAAVTLIRNAARAPFGFDEDYSGLGGNDGFQGPSKITLGGATGFVEADVSDMLGLYATGLQPPSRVPGPGPLTLNASGMKGQTNTSIAVLPEESPLPNVLGLSYLSQYATRIRADQPQIFTVDNQTVRTPAVEFFDRGSGGMGITRKASLSLLGESPVTPAHFPNVENVEQWFEEPYEDPSLSTFISGGLFMKVDLDDDLGNEQHPTTPDSYQLANYDFFFDTGASVTVVSEANAAALGFDVTQDEPEFTIAIVGSGGSKLDVPGFFLDRFKIRAIGGDIVASNVPVVVLDITNPSDPNNVVGGFVGTNLLSGRNLVIDPNPASSGGTTAGLYISDPVTTNSNWTSTSASASWTAAASWSAAATPGNLTIANVRRVAGASQTAVISGSANAWEVNVSGTAANQTMTLSVPTGAALTTFAGLNIEQHGVVALSGGTLDVQYVDIRGGRLTGVGSIATGSGPIPGQVENAIGVVAPGNGAGILNVEGRYANGPDGTLEIEIAGLTPGTQYDRLAVEGEAVLAGTLRVLLPGSFTPALGNQFSVLTATAGVGGEFDELQLPVLAAGKAWHVGYGETSLALSVTLPGDFDGDFTVDAADLDVWSEAFGQHYSGADFLSWQQNLGRSVSLAAAIPEPSTLALVASATGLAVLGRRRDLHADKAWRR